MLSKAVLALSSLGLSSVLAIATTASAGTLHTPEAYVGTDHAASCKLVNVANAAVTVRAQLVEANGNVLADTGEVAVPPGGHVNAFLNRPGAYVFCRFLKASRSKTRASLNIYPLTGDVSDSTIVPAT